jgi:hypothetical protein
VLKGAEKRQTIAVRGDTGALCRPYVSLFPPGTRWVLALSHHSRSSHQGPVWQAVTSVTGNPLSPKRLPGLPETMNNE